MENKNLKIQVLVSVCPTCKRMFELVVKAVKELELKTEAEYVSDIQKIIDMGLMSSPILAINGKPAKAGFTSDMEKIKKIIQNNL